MTRTYSKQVWQAAHAAWEVGDFGDEWTYFRGLAAERGIIFPPNGSRYDAADSASQRAIIHRALRDTPRALAGHIEASSTWGEVVRRILDDIERRRRAIDAQTRGDHR